VLHERSAKVFSILPWPTSAEPGDGLLC